MVNCERENILKECQEAGKGTKDGIKIFERIIFLPSSLNVTQGAMGHTLPLLELFLFSLEKTSACTGA